MKPPLIIVFFRDCGVTDFCSCKIGIQYVLYISSELGREPGQLLCKFLAENAGAPA